eukprot:9502198-Pyramimonas_sp.AAC.1
MQPPPQDSAVQRSEKTSRMPPPLPFSAAPTLKFPLRDPLQLRLGRRRLGLLAFHVDDQRPHRHPQVAACELA